MNAHHLQLAAPLASISCNSCSLPSSINRMESNDLQLTPRIVHIIHWHTNVDQRMRRQTMQSCSRCCRKGCLRSISSMTTCSSQSRCCKRTPAGILKRRSILSEGSYWMVHVCNSHVLRTGSCTAYDSVLLKFKVAYVDMVDPSVQSNFMTYSFSLLPVSSFKFRRQLMK